MAGGWQLGPVVRGLRGHRAAALLVVVQLGIGLAITVLAVLIGDYFQQRGQVRSDLAEDDLTLVALQQSGRTPPDELAGRRDAYLADVRRAPGSAGVTTVRVTFDTLELPLDRLQVAPGDAPVHRFGLVGGPALVGVSGLRLEAGRDFTADDLRRDDATSAIVSRALARTLFGERDPVGARFVSGAHGGVEIVGVVASMHTPLFGFEPPSVLYAKDDPRSTRTVLLVRSAPGQAHALRAALRALPPRAGVHAAVRPAAEHGNRAPVSAVLGILGTTIGVIILVVLVGSVGLTSYLVVHRTREIGVHRAMGATRRDVVRHFLLENAVLTAAGTCVGIAIVALALPTLFDEQEGFAINWPLVAGVVVTVAALNLAATFIPARKAATISPVVASRTT